MASASGTPSLSRAELRSVFDKGNAEGCARELVGIEVEAAALDPVTGAAVPYGGESGVRALLESLAAVPGAVPEYDRGALVGVRPREGGAVSLEHGGAVEYSSPPAGCVAELAEVSGRALRGLAERARRFGFALVPGGQYPFTSIEEVCWVPHSRTPLMRRHFARLGEAGVWGPRVMSMTLSTQASFDFGSPADLGEKLRTQVAASTPAAALFVNAPMEAGRPCGVLSRRMHYLSRTDPWRTRVIPVTLREDFSVDHFIDWALSLPMIHRSAPDGGRRSAPPVPFGTLLTEGFEDGTRPDLRDWRAHLSQMFTDVRLRETLEMRAFDGPPFGAFAAVPAFWSGLTYHRPSRTAAWELLRGAGPRQHQEALDDIARRGLAARFDGQPVREIAAELLRLSAEGLRARIEAGLERPAALACLDPLHDVLATGATFAERALALWREEPASYPERFVAEHRIR